MSDQRRLVAQEHYQLETRKFSDGAVEAKVTRFVDVFQTPDGIVLPSPQRFVPTEGQMWAALLTLCVDSKI